MMKLRIVLTLIVLLLGLTLVSTGAVADQRILCVQPPGGIYCSDQTNNGKWCVGTDKADVIVGTNGVDYIFGLDGDDYICGMGGNDVIFGGKGNDILEGDNHFYPNLAGIDYLIGGPGEDHCNGGPPDYGDWADPSCEHIYNIP